MTASAQAILEPTGRLISCAWPAAVSPPAKRTESVDLDQLTDEQLVSRGREGAVADRQASLDVLYRRYYSKVAYWCLRICGDREQAADLAQEVFLRVQSRLESFRMESRFSTWLYTVTRSVAINRGQSERRRQASSLDDPNARIPVDPRPDVEAMASESEIAGHFRTAMERDLEPLEAKVLYLHFVDGISLPAITNLLELDNRSGAKKYIVSAKRKMKRRFGRWLLSQERA